MTLRAIGVGGHVTPVATIPLTVASTDDFGLAALRLRLERTLNVEEKEKIEPRTQRSVVTLPLPSDPARPGWITRSGMTSPCKPINPRSEPFSASPPRPMTAARGAQTGRSSVLALQVVSPDELFYEILIRQRAERAKFLAALETMEKQTPVLAGKPSTDDFLRVMRVQHAASRSLTRSPGEWPIACRR